MKTESHISPAVFRGEMSTSEGLRTLIIAKSCVAVTACIHRHLSLTLMWHNHSFNLIPPLMPETSALWKQREMFLPKTMLELKNTLRTITLYNEDRWRKSDLCVSLLLKIYSLQLIFLSFLKILKCNWKVMKLNFVWKKKKS